MNGKKTMRLVAILALAGAAALASGSFAACSKRAPDRSCEVISACRTACDSGGIGACAKVAQAMVTGVGAQRDLKGAIELLERACKADEAAACTNLSSFYRSGIGVERDVDHANALLKKATERYEAECKTGAVDSCYGAYVARRDGPPSVRDAGAAAQHQTRVLDLARTECKQNKVASCRVAATVVDGLPDRGRNTPSSQEILEEACAGGSAGACRIRGEQYAQGLGIAKDAAKATEKYERAHELLKAQCDQDLADRCYLLGAWRAADGAYLKKPADPAPAYVKACELGDPGGCAYAAPSIGRSFEGRAGDPLKGDEYEKKSIELYDRACNEGWASLCLDLAYRIVVRVVGERGVAQDHVAYLAAYKRALKLLDADCDAQDVNACRSGAEATGVEGKFGPKIKTDLAKSKTFLERACKLGDDASCRKSKTMVVPSAQPVTSVEVPVPVPVTIDSAPLVRPAPSGSAAPR